MKTYSIPVERLEKIRGLVQECFQDIFANGGFLTISGLEWYANEVWDLTNAEYDVALGIYDDERLSFHHALGGYEY